MKRIPFRFLSVGRLVRGLWLAALLLVAPPPVLARSFLDDPAASFGASPLHAGIGSYLSGMATRSRVIQLCVVCMCIALVIIMKKFAEVGARPGSHHRR